jgi:ParB family chromosome partitioning protein
MSDILDIPVSDIHCDEVDFNCRGVITPMEVMELADSIKKKGLLQPVVVIPYGEEKVKATGFKYLLIAGYRRFTAMTKILRLESIQASVQENMSEVEARAINLTENLQRKDLNLLQEAKALEKMYKAGLSEAECGEQVGKCRSWVQTRFNLLKLPEDIQNEVAAGIFVQSQVKDLYTVMHRYGLDKTYEVARKFKDARLKGQGTILERAKLKGKRKAKILRKKGEMLQLIDHLGETIGMGLHTRVLAWSAGEISDIDLEFSIKEWDDTHGEGDYVVRTRG